MEETLAYKVNNGKTLLGNFLTNGHVDHHIKIGNDADLRIPLHSTTHTHIYI